MKKVAIANIGIGKLFKKSEYLNKVIIDFSGIESKAVIRILIIKLIQMCGKDIVNNIDNIDNKLGTLYLLSKQQKVA